VSTHSSRPQHPTALDRLARALDRVGRYRSAPRLSPLDADYFRAVARTTSGRRQPTARPRARPAEPGRSSDWPAGRPPECLRAAADALLRTPFTTTIVEGGIRSNVIPGAAEATVNMRLLPGVTGEEAVRELRQVIDDPTSSHRRHGHRLCRGGVPDRPGAQRIADSNTDTDLTAHWRARSGPRITGTVVTPALYEAATDAGPWRERNIPVYGIRPTGSASDLERHARHRRAGLHPRAQRGTDMVERIRAPSPADT
jgi:acetylornithine deacetylase/succinyl-diaminopimelate desuccinylase-like protein